MYAWLRKASTAGPPAAAAALQGCPGGGSGSPSVDAGGGTPGWTALAGLPADHGLFPDGRGTLLPGGVEVGGTVEVSCPAGGPACVLRVAADRTVQYESTGGTPSVVPRFTTWRNLVGGDHPAMSAAGFGAAMRRIAGASDSFRALSRSGPDTDTLRREDVACCGNTCTWPGGLAVTPTVAEGITFAPFLRRNGVELHFSKGTRLPVDWDFGVRYDETGVNAVLDYTAARSVSWLYYDGSEADPYRLEGAKFVFGDVTGHNPVAGSATWSGVVFGVAETALGDAPPFVGEAAIAVHFGRSPTVDVNFANLRDIDGGSLVLDPWTSLPLTGGSFRGGSVDGGRYIDGRFFGPDAEEVGGMVVDDGVSNAGLRIGGVFAGAR